MININDANLISNTLTEYYSKKQKYAATRKNQNYSDLLSLASTDSVIAILERQLSQDDKGICIRENTCAISNLSQLWRAKKRQNDENRMGILHDDDGHEIDPLDLLMINDTNNDLSNCIVKILKKQDAVYSVILDLYIQGYTQLEISGKIGKSLITVKRLFKALSSFLAPLADDIADYIRLQDSAPSYAWASSHRVNLPKLDRSVTSASLPGVTSDNSCKDKTLQWLFSAKKDITKIS